MAVELCAFENDRLLKPSHAGSLRGGNQGTVILRIDAFPDSARAEARFDAHAARLCVRGEMVSSIAPEVRQLLSAVVMDTDTNCPPRASEFVHPTKPVAQLFESRRQLSTIPDDGRGVNFKLRCMLPANEGSV